MRDRSLAQNRRRQPRRGLAATELAVCLPVIVLLVLAMIEACTMIFLKQSLTVASYEGARTALRQNASAADVRSACEAVLADRRVQGGSVTLSPSNLNAVAPGEYIDVVVSAPTESNSVIPGSFMRGMTLSGTASMMKEF